MEMVGGTRLATGMCTTGAEGAPADAGASSTMVTIEKLLRCADEIEPIRPRVAYLCRLQALRETVRLHGGRGFIQFKTELINRLQNEEQPTREACGEITDQDELTNFFLDYADKANRRWRSGDYVSREDMSAMFINAHIVYQVLCQHAESRNSGPLAEKVARAGADVERRARELSRRVFNIVSLDLPAKLDHAGQNTDAFSSAAIPFMPVDDGMMPEVFAAVKALQGASRLPPPPGVQHQFTDTCDVFDWLQVIFGFQRSNAANQREHLVLLLASGQSHHVAPTHDHARRMKHLDEKVVRWVWDKALSNYKYWCNSLDIEPVTEIAIKALSASQGPQEVKYRLVFVSLYLLIWGEAANLRFLPECLCYIFHRMARDTHDVLEKKMDPKTGALRRPACGGPEGTFMKEVVKPVYSMVRAEHGNSTVRDKENVVSVLSPSLWKNYDDINEYFWTDSCMTLGWPWHGQKDFFLTTASLRRVPKAQAAHNTLAYENPPEPGSQGGAGFSTYSSGRVARGCCSCLLARWFRSAKARLATPTAKTALERRSFSMVLRAFPSYLGFIIISLIAMILFAFRNPDRQKHDVNLNLVFPEFMAELVEAGFRAANATTLPPVENDSDDGVLSVNWDDFFMRSHFWRSTGVCVCAYALLNTLQAMLEIHASLRILIRMARLKALKLLLQVLLHGCWSAAFVYAYYRMMEQCCVKDQVQPTEYDYTFLEMFGLYVLPDVLRFVLTSIPRLQQWAKTSNLSAVKVVRWWFTSEAYIGRAMIEKTRHKILYTLFWLVICGCKLLFSYFFQVKPLVNVSRNMWRDCSVQYNWFEFAPGCVNFGVTVFHLWVPTVTVYIIDMGIWYSIFSTLVGAFSGGRARQGEIRNMTMLRARFETFPRAFNKKFLHVDEGLATQRGIGEHGSPSRSGHAGSASVKPSHRNKDGRSSRPLIRQEEVEFAERFSVLWNEFIECMREEDLISNKERDMLKMPKASEEVPVVQWPIFLLAGKVQGALDVAVGWGSSTRTEHIWGTIKKNAYTRYAVQEAYYLFKAILGTIVVGDEEKSAVQNIFTELEKNLHDDSFGRRFCAKSLPMVLDRVLALLKSLVELVGPGAHEQVVRDLQNLYDTVLYEFMAKPTRERLRLSLRRFSHLQRSAAALTAAALQHGDESNDDDYESDAHLAGAANPADLAPPLFARLGGKPAVLFPLKEKQRPAFHAKASRLFSLLTPTSVLASALRSAEVRRRLLFFGNSLFMKMPSAPRARSMRSFSTLVRCNQGDVIIYSHGELVRKNASGTSLLEYLRVVYKDQFENFLERLCITPSEVWKQNDALELRLWASYRGQTVARAVRGAMYHQRAVQLAAFVDSAPIDVLRGGFSRRHATSGADLQDAGVFSLNVSLLKFSCVLSCPAYGKMKLSADARAMDVLELLKRHDGLRLSYVDDVDHEVPFRTDGAESVATHSDSVTGDLEAGHGTELLHQSHDSVLCKWHSGREEEIYRIRLPGPAALGEERPEYENTAVVFTRGSGLQVVDVHHDNCLEEAFKMRNLMEGFDEKAHSNTKDELRPPAIQGLGQSMVTDQVTSISEFAAIEEGTRASIQQRTMADPLRVRMHYGRPDVFDRLWILTRGGVNKPSLLLHHSPGIHAGFNAVLRGGRVTHNEYIQTLHVCGNYGMGDVWQDQSIKAIGAGMQARSRDVARLGRQFDVFREMSFYHTHVGTHVIDTVVVVSVYLYLFGKLYVALGGISEDLLRHSLVVEAVANAIWMWWSGFLPLLPFFMEMGLQKGFKVAILEVGVAVFQLAPMYFAINMGTRLHYFYLTMMHGITAKHVEWQTKRSFAMQHTTFVDNFRMYSRSHFIRAFELLMLLMVYVIFGKYDLGDFGIVTFALWFLVFTWLLGPFILNPGGLEWRMITADFDEFLMWIFKYGGPGVSAADSWESWWEEEQSPLQSTGFMGRLVEMVFQLRFFVFQYGIAYTLSFSRASLTMYAASWVFVALLVIVLGLSSITINYYNQGESRLYRLVQAIAFVAIITTFSTLLATGVIEWQDIGGTLVMLVATFWGLLQLGIAARPCSEFLHLWSIIKFFARQFDLGMATALMLPISILSWFPFLAEFQMRLLCTQRGSESELFTRTGVRKANNDEE